MAYGFEINNSKGDRVVEFKKTLYAAETGTTRPEDDIYSEAGTIANGLGYSATARTRLPGNLYAMLGVYQMAAQTPQASVRNSCTIIGPEFNLLVGDTVFYKISSKGMHGQVQVFCDLPGGYPVDKGVGLVCTEDNSSIPYIVASTSAPNGSGETYGLQIRDDAGVVTFDSRKPLFSVFHSFIITAADCDGVINTGTAKVYTLPKSVAGAYVSAPSLLGFKSYSGGGYAILLKQTANNKLTLSRVSNGTLSGAFKFWTQDTPVFVGRPL